MHVFVTGATGFVGSAVVRELLEAGHRVTGLARSDTGAAEIAAVGAEPHRGDLEDLESLRRGAEKADAVIHTAFNHDFSRFAASCEHDRQVIAALSDPLVGSERPLIVTSGLGLLTPGRLAKESEAAYSGPHATPRVATEQAAAAVAERGVRVSIMRLPPSVHGDGDHGFVPILTGIARAKGASAVVGDGLNRWPAAHRLDVATLYRLVLEAGRPGATFHASAEEGVPFREIAEVIGRRLGVPVVTKAPDEAADHFGWIAHFAAMDIPSSSAWTRETTGWRPTRPGLIADLDRPAYFER